MKWTEDFDGVNGEASYTGEWKKGHINGHGTFK